MLVYWLGFVCIFLFALTILFIVLFAKSTSRPCSSGQDPPKESDLPLEWPTEQHVFEPKITQPTQLKICLMVLSDVKSKEQIQYQRLWQQWDQLLGIPNNITTYLLVANKRENLDRVVSFDSKTRLVMFNDMEDSLVPGILKKTIRLLNYDLFSYDWYVRTTAATFFDPVRLISILTSLREQTPLSNPPILAGSFITDATLGRFVQGRCMIWNESFTKQLRQQQDVLFSYSKPDDMVLSQSFSNVHEISLPDIVLPMRSTDTTLAQEFLNLCDKCQSSNITWAAINSVNNGAMEQKRVDRTIDLALFGHFLLTRVDFLKKENQKNKDLEIVEH